MTICLSTTTERFLLEATEAIATCARAKSGPNTCALPVRQLVLELAGDALLIGGVARPAHLRRELAVERRLVDVDLGVRVVEGLHRREAVLVDVADVAQVGGRGDHADGRDEDEERRPARGSASGS